MSDIRKCDNPECEVFAPLNDISLFRRQQNYVSAESFITLECPREQDKHFHNNECLQKFVLERTKVK